MVNVFQYAQAMVPAFVTLVSDLIHKLLLVIIHIIIDYKFSKVKQLTYRYQQWTRFGIAWIISDKQPSHDKVNRAVHGQGYSVISYSGYLWL